jgi:hypothetical protein
MENIKLEILQKVKNYGFKYVVSETVHHKITLVIYKIDDLINYKNSKYKTLYYIDSVDGFYINIKSKFVLTYNELMELI